jgi:hypothetical protein
MKFIDKVKSASIFEIVLFFVFVIYLIFPINFPASVNVYIDSSLGMIVMFCITVYLLLYKNPILAVLYVFVAYELLRRSMRTTASSGQTAYIQYTEAGVKRDSELKQMNAPVEQRSLEEDVVAVMAPIGKSEMPSFVDASFKPVADNVKGAAPI